MWQSLNSVLGQTLETVLEPAVTLQHPQANGTYTVHTLRLNGNAFDVVAQCEDGDVFYDLFDVMSGQCINEGCPLYDLPPRNLTEWPAAWLAMVVEFYAHQSSSQSRL